MRFIMAWAGTAVALFIAALLVGYTMHPWLLASLGGSCVILFGMPENEMAQPRSVLGGHVIASVIGLIFLHFSRAAGVGSANLWMIAAMATSLVAMMATRTIHSPAGANTIVIFAEKADWSFLLSPLAIGLLVIFVVALVVNNKGRLPWHGRYPRSWI
jgi:CBS-domain-containing membrane protein